MDLPTHLWLFGLLRFITNCLYAYNKNVNNCSYLLTMAVGIAKQIFEISNSTAKLLLKTDMACLRIHVTSNLLAHCEGQDNRPSPAW